MTKGQRRALIAALLAVPQPIMAAQNDPIVVTGEREKQAEAAGDQARAITLRPRIDKPLARHYAPVCVTTFGVDAAYGAVMAQRVADNVRALGLPAGGTGCSPNVWIGFIRDSKAEVARLRQREPAMFALMKNYEADRVLAGSGAVQVWHATEIRNVDGRPIRREQVYIPDRGPADIDINTPAQAGRLKTPIRTDINGTIILFDRARADGLTVRQLADHATFRILAPVQDAATVEPGTIASILHLFAAGAERADGLTSFDWAYLSAYYKLDRGARASSVHDAVRRTMLDGTGQKLQDRADAP